MDFLQFVKKLTEKPCSRRVAKKKIFSKFVNNKKKGLPQVFLNACDAEGNTAVHWCCIRSQEEVLGVILAAVGGAAGAHISIHNKDGETPLHIAVKSLFYQHLVKHLLSAGANPNEVDKHGESPLHLAARRGQAALAADLLAAGGNVSSTNKYSDTPLCLALVGGHHTTANVFLSAATMTEEAMNATLHHVVRWSNIAGAMFLLNGAANTIDVTTRDDTESTVLHHAAENGDVGVMLKLLARGAEPHARNKFFELPLHFAARAGKKDAVQLLIAVMKLGDLSIQTKFDETPLFLASKNLHAEVSHILLRASQFTTPTIFREKYESIRTPTVSLSLCVEVNAVCNGLVL